MRNLIMHTALVLTVGAPVAQAGDLAPIARDTFRDLESTSAYTGTSTVSGITKLDHLFDGVEYTSWVGAGPEPVQITVNFIGTRYIGGLGVTPGCAGSNRTFGEFSRPAILRVQAGDRSVDIPLTDRRKFQEIAIDPPLVGQSVKITVVNAIRGRMAGVCLSELELRELTALSGLSEAKRNLLEARVAEFDDPTKAKDAVDAVVVLGPGALPRLTVALQSENASVRSSALRALAAIGSPIAADSLIRFWLTKPKGDERLLAVKALSKCADVRVIPILGSLMTDADFDLADLAARAVGSFGSAGVPAIEHALRSQHEDVQVRALRALASTRDPRALQLAAPFANAERSPLRAAAVRAIAGTRLPEAMAFITRAAADPHPLVRLAVAKSLSLHEGPAATAVLASLIRDGDELVARVALHRMARRTEGARQLAIYLGERIAPYGDHAISLLASSKSPEALRLMLDALRRGEQRYRQALRTGLANFGVHGLKAILAGALSDTRLQVDAEAVLGAAGAGAVPVIADALSQDSGEPPLFLIRAAGLTRDPSVVPMLDRAWKAGPVGVRIEVMRAYGGLPGTLVGAQIMAGLGSQEAAVRQEAATAAGSARIEAAVPALIAALESRSITAEHVLGALSAFGSVEAEATIIAAFDRRDARMEVRLAALHACRKMHTLGCDDMMTRAGRDWNPDLRAIALRMLATN
jgi:HEAT repeat protein